MNLKTVVGLVFIVGFSGLLFLNFGQQVGGYMNFDQAEASGQRANVVGTWHENQPTRYDRDANVFTFHMEDKNGNVRRVRYGNPKPVNFEEAEKLVVEGRVESDGTFRAQHILVKCPSKYNDAKGLTAEGQTVDS